MELWKYYVKVLKNYVNFKGRARRKEYWGFVLFNLIIAIALSFIGGLIGGLLGDGSGTLGLVLYYLYCLGVILPGLSVLVRRLHDTGRSGWLWLLVLIPLVGAIIVLIWLCSDGQPGENQYGPDPKQV